MKALILLLAITPAYACRDGLHVGLWVGDNTAFGSAISANDQWVDGGDMGHGFDIKYKWHKPGMMGVDLIELQLLGHRSHLFRGEPFRPDLEESSYNSMGATFEWRIEL